MSDKTVIQNAIWAFMFQQFSKKKYQKKSLLSFDRRLTIFMDEIIS
jgi:hypothetical protein